MRRFTVTFAFVVLALSAAVAAARPALKLLARTSGPAVSDGRRWLAAPSAGGTETVLDTFTGRMQRLAPLVYCGPYDQPLVVVGGGLLAWSCSSDVQTGRLADAQTTIVGLATGTIAHPVGLSAVPPINSPASSWVTAIGRYGIAVHRSAYHSGDDVYLDWRAGRQMREPGYRDVVDLDAPSLQRRLCAPMRRTRNVDGFTGQMAGESPYNAFTYESPWGLTERGLDLHQGDYMRVQTVLERCGYASRVLATRGIGEAGARYDYVLGNGLLAWIDHSSSLAARRLSTGRGWRWHSPGGATTPGLPAQVALTRNHVALSLPPKTVGGAWRVYLARLR